MFNILENISLKPHNTFAVEAFAKRFVEISSAEQFKNLLQNEDLRGEELLILGGGSNILFTEDFNGLVIKNSIGGISITKETDAYVIISAGAGVIWDDLVDFCVTKNLGGIENLKLIPGTVGAAPIQNIGAYGAELVDVFESLTGIFIQNFEEKTFMKDECKFGYRSSVFKTDLKGKFFITEVRLKLNKKPRINLSYKALKDSVEEEGIANPTIKDVSRHVKNIRESKLPNPSDIGNAGSFFKNAEVHKSKVDELIKIYPDLVFYKVDNEIMKIPSGWLIDKCGLKGLRKGNTGTHDKQALVIVNLGGATGKEIYEIAMFVKEKVKNVFGIELIPEVNII
ncbi:MAG: UDP-N-acetylmuramate dehydrogenase [Ignavibacteriae bacterium]|nr:UDP-N-acetylmuramate dehydrogenase [Ignavibacteriota bacterium]NOG99154.1 UDP-N-acetylmuramate dehydrogenase [Ignavibacteriota bacterium]